MHEGRCRALASPPDAYLNRAPISLAPRYSRTPDAPPKGPPALMLTRADDVDVHALHRLGWSISRSPDTWVMIARPSAPTSTVAGSPGSTGTGGAESVYPFVDYRWKRLAEARTCTALFDGLVLVAFRGKRLRGPELACAPVTASQPLDRPSMNIVTTSGT